MVLQSSSGQFQVVLSDDDLREAVALLQVADVMFESEGISDIDP